VSGHGQTSLTVPLFVVNLNFFNSPIIPDLFENIEL